MHRYSQVDDESLSPHPAGVRFPATFRRRSRLALLAAGLACCLIVYYSPVALFSAILPHIRYTTCPQSGNVGDILVVVRTGATEVREKLPIHFDTTLRCVPDLLIYSDYDEWIQGHAVHDVLKGVNGTLVATEPDFAHYRHLQVQGRQGLDMKTHLGSGPRGSDNPAWKLDRFKFLPMVDGALHRRKAAKWFVFIEADTYLVWRNLLAFLSHFDSRDAHYMGREMTIGTVLFGHGGSGFVLSNAAMHKIVAQRNQHLYLYDQFTVSEWAGDMVLGKALSHVGVDLTWAWPHFEDNALSTLDLNATVNGKTPWCHAPLTYHHMQTPDIRQFYDFERDWQRKHGAEAILLYKNVFKQYFLPKMAAARVDETWDNLSNQTQLAGDPILTKTRDECQAACEAVPDCLQYSYTSGTCATSSVVRYGTKPAGDDQAVHSGWMMDRVARYVEEMDSSCSDRRNDMWAI